jgi:hypothetical protein
MPCLRRLLAVCLAAAALAGASAGRTPDRLVSRPLVVGPAEKALAVGALVETGPGQRRRLRLPGGALVFLHERSRLRLSAADRLTLAAGEAFVETAPGQPAVHLDAPRRKVSARGGRFGVRVGQAGSRVLVAVGEATVAGLDGPLRAGQVLGAGDDRPRPARRVSHLLAWTRDLRTAAPLVPASPHAGGSLVARDPDGEEMKLQLRRYHVDVHVEAGFARTTIDQTYFNASQERLEGTFRFPLPADASLSRLAMYVGGKRMEGGMAERDYARGVFERIVWEKRDPALLEWVDGTTFKMRVFPLEPRQEKRVLLSYTQRLPALYETTTYRFPAGHSLGEVADWSLHARVKGGAGLGWDSVSHTLAARTDGKDLVLDAKLKNARLDRDVVLTLAEPAAGGAAERARFAQATLGKDRYLLVRYRPELPPAGEAPRRDWVVLVETSADRDPLLARTQVELLRAVLGCARPDDTLSLVTAATRTRKLHARPARLTPAAAAEAVAELEKAHLVGALDLGQALADVRPLLEAAQKPVLLHVGSGVAALGECRTDRLLAALPKGTEYVGVGVGRRWNRAFMQEAAERTGGYFTQVNPDEPVAWRGLDLAMTLNTPRLLDVRLSDPDGKTAFLPFVRLCCQGEEVAAVARLDGERPATVRVEGTLSGKPFRKDLAVQDVQPDAGCLPRSWAKLEIDRLLAADPAKHRKEIIGLSKEMYVMTPFTSLLVLEDEDMYTRFKVDRGRKDHWAMYPAPARIPVVVEPLEGDPGDPKKGIKPSARFVAETVRTRPVPSVFRGQRPLGISPLEIDAILSKAVTESITEQDSKGGTASGRALSAATLGDWKRREDWTLDALNEAEKAPARARPNGNRVVFQAGSTGVRALDHALTNTDLGMDDRLPLAYSVDRIEGLGGLPTRLGRPDVASLAQMGAVVIRQGAIPAARRGVFVTEADFNATLPSPSPGTAGGSLLYARPGYSNDDRLFFDLPSYAPGLNSSAADLRGVVEAEARFDPALRPGKISAGARALFERARKAGWRTLAVPPQGRTPGYRVSFDGAGRYAWERTLSSGLRERVACDGKTLWHAYPELGLAARRAVSRHHRLAFARVVPWVLPLPEDLARGADLELIDAHTVAVVPHAAKAAGKKEGARLHLVFKDGGVIERRLVLPGAKQTPPGLTCAADGTVKLLGSDGKEISSRKWALEDADAPPLEVNLKDLVVVDMPFRTPARVREALKLGTRNNAELTFDEARQLLAAFVGAGDANAAVQVFQQALANREQRQLGYYVLLAAAGANLDGDNLDVLDAHPHAPLAHYLALFSSPVLRKHASRWAAASNTFAAGPLARLARGHALCQRWSSGKSLGTSARGRQEERARALAYVKQHQGTALAWALLGLVQDRTAEEKDAQKAYAELAAAYELFADSSLAPFARYEAARCWWKAGKGAEARRRFAALFTGAVKQGGLLSLDGDFRAALLGGPDDGWAGLLRRTAAAWGKQGSRFAVLALARQCWQLGDQAMGQHLYAAALAGLDPKDKQAAPLKRAALAFLSETDQTALADRLVGALLKEPANANDAGLWKQAAELAEKREMPARALECREKVLELKFAAQPEVINLQQVREEYGVLLGQYAELARSLAALSLKPPAGFRDRVVAAADRWRALDSDQADAARAAAEVLRRLGERELAWDYLTTPVALRPGEAGALGGLAEALRRQGERDLADRAYHAAFQRESTNAQLLFDRAANLGQMGRLAQARALYRRVAEGDWQPRFATLKIQARWLLER